MATKTRVFSKTSGIVEMTGPIFSNIFMSERLLLSYVDLKVVLNQSSNEFCLMASENDVDYHVKHTDAYLKIRKVKVNPSISVAHEIALKKRLGHLSCMLRRMQKFHNRAGNPSLRKDNIFNRGLCRKHLSLELSKAMCLTVPLKRICTIFNISTCPPLE